MIGFFDFFSESEVEWPFLRLNLSIFVMSNVGLEPFELPLKILGKRIVLKKLELSLAPIMFEYVDKNRERLGRFLLWVSGIKSVKDEEEFIQFTHTNWNNHTGFCYGIFDIQSKKYIGNISAFDIRWKHAACEMGYWILGQFEGMGLMQDAVLTLEAKLFELGFHRLVIRCDPNNERSEKLARRMGYSLDGIMRHDILANGSYRDTMVFSKLSTLTAHVSTKQS